MSRILTFIFMALILLRCKTGSNFEKFQQELTAANSLPSLSQPGNKIITIDVFTFADEPYKFNSYFKGFLIPGYTGVDEESNGYFPAKEKAQGFDNIYDHPEFTAKFREFVQKKMANKILLASNAESIRVSGQIIASDTALRLHTYGWFPFIGSLVHLFNGKITTLVNKTTLKYMVIKSRGGKVEGEISVITEKTYHFWSSAHYGFGMAIGKMQKDAMQAHMKEINEKLYRTLLAIL